MTYILPDDLANTLENVLPPDECSSTTITQDYEEEKSVIPGNIGIVKCSAMVWEHDPFFVRPFQQKVFPFNKDMVEGEHHLPCSNVEVEANGLMLQPTPIPRDMFVCTINKPEKPYTNWDGKEVSTLRSDIDLVGSKASGVGAQAALRLPGGWEYENERTFYSNLLDLALGTIIGLLRPKDKREPYIGKRIFSHQLWKHVGSLLDDRVFVHPSEYRDDTGTVLKKKWNIQTILETLFFYGFGNLITRQLIEHSPRFNYEMRQTQGISFICPMQERKHVPGQGYTVHWTLEKYLPVWQGQDFVFSYFPHDKHLDSPRDPTSNINSTLSLRDKSYDYLSYMPPNSEIKKKDDEHYDWIEGVSNEAFLVPNIREEKDPKKIAAVRSVYHWGFVNYLLIEFGTHSENDRYFIEIVKGRTPRFLHVGYQWEDLTRLVKTDGEDSTWAWVKKCREIKAFQGLSSEQLLKNPFTMTARHHMGDLVLTFNDAKNVSNTYVVRRNDVRSDKRDRMAKQRMPICIPNDVVRIHGGNISCSINYSPMTYVPNGNIQLPPHDFETCAKPTDDDVFVTASRIGNSKTGKMTTNYRLKELFDDNLTPIDYDVDTYQATEIIKNAQKVVPVYDWLPKFKDSGRGWYRALDGTSELVNGQRESPSNVEFYCTTPESPGSGKGRMPLTFKQGDKTYDWLARWQIGVNLYAGSMKMHSSGIDSNVTEDAEFPYSITPIINCVRGVLRGGGKPFSGNEKAVPFDIAPLIQTITDSWSTDNLTTITHEMQVKCYIPRGEPTGFSEGEVGNVYSPGESLKTTEGPGEDNTNLYDIAMPLRPDSILSQFEHSNLYALAQKLLSMRDKTMYITVRYWWDKGIGLRSSKWNKLDNQASLSVPPETNDLLIQMTGIAQAPELEVHNNKMYMNFSIYDYMKTMRDQKIFNSPFFDGVSDTLAMYELGKMASLDENPNVGSTGVDRSPMAFIVKRLSIDPKDADRPFILNGELTRSISYDLPGSYNTLVSPAMRFRDGDDFESAFRKISERGGKSVYFDRWGVLRLEDNPAKIVSFGLKPDEVDTEGHISDAQLKEYLTPKFNFYTSPLPFDSGVPLHAPPSWYEGTNVEFDPRKHAAHLVYNVIRHKTMTDQVFSKIALGTAANDITVDGKKTGLSGLIYKGTTFYEMLNDPSAEGFLGYRRIFWQQEGAFGDLDTIMQSLKHYTKLKHPILSVTFETYGIPGLKPFDIITLDNALYYIMEISHDIDAETNNWWMTITARWFKEGLAKVDIPRGELEQQGNG